MLYKDIWQAKYNYLLNRKSYDYKKNEKNS